MNKPSKYILLPTDKEIESGDLVKLPNGKVQIMSENDMVHQHLYILSDDEIKEGDWVLVGNKNVRKVNYNDTEDTGRFIVVGESNAVLRRVCKKIIATNPELWASGDSHKNNVAQISQSDIEYIISLYNGKGKEVDIEKLAFDYSYQWRDSDVNISDAHEEGYKDGYNQCLQDNADKKFSLEDMMNFGLICYNRGQITDFEKDSFKERDKWIKNKIESFTKEQPKSDTVMVEYEEVYTGTLNQKGSFVPTMPKIKDGCIVIVRD